MKQKFRIVSRKQRTPPRFEYVDENQLMITLVSPDVSSGRGGRRWGCVGR